MSYNNNAQDVFSKKIKINLNGQNKIKCFLLTSAWLFCGALQAENNSDITSLAQSCYAIQSPATGKFLKLHHKGGPVHDGFVFRFNTDIIDDSSHFFLKPTSFNHYLITEQSGRFISTHFPGSVSGGKEAGRKSEWQISVASDEGEPLAYTFRSTLMKRDLRHNTNTGKLYFFNLTNPRNKHSEKSFYLVKQQDCKPYPEAELNITGTDNSTATHSIRGFVDAHAHITSNEFLGGKALHGKPFHRWGIEKALNNSKGIHGPNGSLDLIGNLQVYGDINFRYDTRGYPDFPFWPNRIQQTHTGYYYKWIERAHKGGLKMIVTHLVENEVLCTVQKTINPGSWINANNCNPVKSIELQIKRLHEMQDYIDAQAGGPGRGFFRLVDSPAQARQVIKDGKLAVMLGIEASELFNCGLKDRTCTEQYVESQLQKVYAAGVRALYPVHRFDNQFGGSNLEDGLINLGHLLSTGRFFETKECDANTKGVKMKSGFPLIGQVPVLKQILERFGLSPEYDETRLHCNATRLSDLGRYLVNRMIDMGMIVEVDHMSFDTASDVIEIIESRGYSGLVSSHSFMNTDSDGSVHELTKRVARSGGILAKMNRETHEVASGIERYLDIVETTPYLAGVPFSADMGGIARQAAPRDDVDVNPLVYPFTTESGLIFDKQHSGNRTFDYNQDGVAHYGLLADHLQDIRERASERVYESIMNSAEAYVQMWERAEQH